MDKIDSESYIINKIKEIENKMMIENISAEDLGKSSFILQFMLNNFSRRHESSEINTKLQELIGKIERKKKSILHS